jgi:putative phosphoesterase
VSPNRSPITFERAFAAPLTIGVLSDTHIYPGSRRTLDERIPALFRRFGCGLIVHAGDCNTIEALPPLAEIAPLLVVVGNNDIGELLELAPLELTFGVGAKTVAVLHGDGGRSARSEAKERFAGKADLVIYGHSHIPMIEQAEGSILFNPGSPTDRRWHAHFGIGIIRIGDGGIDPELILFNHPAELANVEPR